MNGNLPDQLSHKLREIQESGLFRELLPQKKGVDLYSNDYLGWANTNELDTIPDNLCHGSTGSRLLSGNAPEAVQLEKRIAESHGFEEALLFNSGYTANLGLLSCIANKHDTFILDELVHASILDGVRLSPAKKFTFQHNNLQSLEKKLKVAEGNVFVVVESLYSMNGDFAPIEEILSCCEKYGAFLIVDEAHAIGVWGKSGKGLVCDLQVQSRVFACVYTFGKAIGLHGAAVCGAKQLKDFLVNFSRPFIYTTAPSPQTCGQLLAAYRTLENHRPNALFGLISYFQNKTKAQQRWKFIDSKSQIQGVFVHGNQEVLRLANFLEENGLLVKAIRHPTVKMGEERIRICLHDFNTPTEIDLLFDLLTQYE